MDSAFPSYLDHVNQGNSGLWSSNQGNEPYIPGGLSSNQGRSGQLVQSSSFQRGLGHNILPSQQAYGAANTSRHMSYNGSQYRGPSMFQTPQQSLRTPFCEGGSSTSDVTAGFIRYASRPREHSAQARTAARGGTQNLSSTHAVPYGVPSTLCNVRGQAISPWVQYPIISSASPNALDHAHRRAPARLASSSDIASSPSFSFRGCGNLARQGSNTRENHDYRTPLPINSTSKQRHPDVPRGSNNPSNHAEVPSLEDPRSMPSHATTPAPTSFMSSEADDLTAKQARTPRPRKRKNTATTTKEGRTRNLSPATAAHAAAVRKSPGGACKGCKKKKVKAGAQDVQNPTRRPSDQYSVLT